MHRPLIRASMVTLLFVLLLSIALPALVVVPPASAAPLAEIPPPPTDAVLLSQGKPVEADYSCIYVDDCQYPWHANDGNDGTFWFYNEYISSASTITEVGVSWTVDLGDIHELTRLDIRWFTGVNSYQVSISDDNQLFLPIFTDSPSDTLTSTLLEAQARYVRITALNDSMIAGAYEIQVYGREVGPLDLTVTDSGDRQRRSDGRCPGTE